MPHCQFVGRSKNKLEPSIKNRHFSHLLRNGLSPPSAVVLNGFLCLPPAKGHSNHCHCKLCWTAVSNFLGAKTDLDPTCEAGEEDTVRTAENLTCVCFGDIPCSFELDTENYSVNFSFNSLPFYMFLCCFIFLPHISFYFFFCLEE